MRSGITAVLLTTLIFSGTALADNGMRVIESHHDMDTTLDRLLTMIEERDMTVFRITDHAANAAGINESLPPTRLVVFGNPQVGTELMQCGRTVAMDLPMKALVWEDDDGVWLGYNDMRYLAERHGLEDCGGVVDKVQEALLGLMGMVAGR